LRYWVGERQCEGKTSIYRGPLLLAYEERSPSTLDYSEGWKASADLDVTDQAGSHAVFTFEGDAVEWHGKYFDDAGKARIVVDDGEGEIVDQYGPQRGAPFVWKREGLGPGKHTIRLEVLGEKSPDSKGTWVNIYNFSTPTDLPKLDARRLSDRASVTPTDDGILMLEVPGATGQVVRLRDFGSAGRGGALYFSWLPVHGVQAAPFSKTNPSRTSRAAN
jgi:hypothetical protein